MIPLAVCIPDLLKDFDLLVGLGINHMRLTNSSSRDVKKASQTPRKAAVITGFTNTTLAYSSESRITGLPPPIPQSLVFQGRGVYRWAFGETYRWRCGH